MKIDVIISTYNRAALLERAVRSVIESSRHCANPAEFNFLVTVVDNNSTDDTADIVDRLARQSPAYVNYLFEPRQGKSFAVNRGIEATSGEVIAFVDDDQLMGEEWLCAIHQCIKDGFDYATGPVYGEWEVETPAWYDWRVRGAISLFDSGGERLIHGDDEQRGGFSGGNGAVRRSIVEKIGGFRGELGKMAGTLVMCEDGEFYIRLKRAGARGLYEPRMKVFHRVPGERMTKDYFRSWYEAYGRSMALIDTLHPKPVNYFMGIPRFILRQGIEAFPRIVAAKLRGDRPGAFEQELNIRFALGFIKGKMF